MGGGCLGGGANRRGWPSSINDVGHSFEFTRGW